MTDRLTDKEIEEIREGTEEGGRRSPRRGLGDGYRVQPAPWSLSGGIV